MMKDSNGSWTKKQAVILAFELGYVIAIPILIFGLLGKYLDNRFHTNPIFKIFGLLLAITSSTIWLSQKFSEVFKSMTKKDK